MESLSGQINLSDELRGVFLSQLSVADELFTEAEKAIFPWEAGRKFDQAMTICEGVQLFIDEVTIKQMRT